MSRQFTHAARYQARDIAENMRKGEEDRLRLWASQKQADLAHLSPDYTIMNKTLLDHTNVYTSSEYVSMCALDMKRAMLS